jgi:hypothetical protein
LGQLHVATPQHGGIFTGQIRAEQVVPIALVGSP